jgi:hypothetical protein
MTENTINSKLKSISFSSLGDNKKCGHYFKLKHILRVLADTNTMWTHYGTWMHKYVQATLSGELEPSIAAKKFIRSWFTFCRLYKKPLVGKSRDEPTSYYKGPVRAIMTIKEDFEKEFGKFKILCIEERLREATKYPQVFTGYIDIVIELENGDIVIADFKSCPSHFMFNKYKDKYRDYQLTLYKHHYCMKYGVDPKKVETYFVTIAKDPKIKKPTTFMRVTSGPKKVQNALDWLNGALAAVEKKMFVKNKTACDDFYGNSCPYKNTPHCP